MLFKDLFVCWYRTPQEARYSKCDTLQEASGLCMVCPKCQRHRLILWKEGVGQGVHQKPGRWRMTGTDENNITLDPSIRFTGKSCQAHFFIRNGMIEMLND